MYHTIEFRVGSLAAVEVLGSDRLTQVFIEKGTRLRADIKPYVMESDLRPIEVADLYLEDGSVARTVPFAFFHFIDE